MSYEDYQDTDTDAIRIETRDRFISQYEPEIEIREKQIAQLRSLIADLK